ncbi:MAG: trypsin-like peptidase domain-containing protein [Bacteroidota bacterium]
MTGRRFLFALALIAVGVLIGLPIARVFAPEPPAPEQAIESAAPPPAAVEVDPIPFGPDETSEPLPPTAEIPELRELNRLFTGVADLATESVVYVEVDASDGDPYAFGARTTAGSGVIVSPAGYVVTNAHVLEGGRRVTVVLDDKREYAAEVVGRDPTTDLAVLRLLEIGVAGDLPLPVATLADSDELEVGEWVLAVGSPFRLTGTVTQGIVSALGRSVGAIQNEVFIEDFIQTDASINQGNSGGALVNLDGEVVGVVTAIATESGISQGYGFAVPSNLVKRVTEDLVAYGEVRRGYVGIQVGEMTAADARERGMDRIRGVLVSDVYGGGPGARAGLQPGDVLLEVNGVSVDATNRFQSRVALAQPTDQLALTIWREGEEQQLQSSLVTFDDPGLQRWIAGGVAPAEPPEEAPTIAPPDVPRAQATDYGVRLRDLTPDERRTFNVTAGAFVEAVEPESAAFQDGLPQGTVVIEVEGEPVASAAEAQAVLSDLARSETPALLRVRRVDGLTAFYDLLSPEAD